ncbi:MAG: helix-turn-helix domain-containing protein [Candidatus Palauibacterales bacterium]|nr:helix-turn-helix domain-containing protein [Candidatus Palauibacterales bacterium]
MTETGQVEWAARRAIGRAKRRGDAEVTADDLLVGALAEISRFDVAWIGDRAVDLRALCLPEEEPSEAADAAPDAVLPAYGPGAVELFERAAHLAREDGAGSTGLVHLLAAVADVPSPLRDRLFSDLGLSDAEWRAELARGVVGAPPRLAGGSKGASATTVGAPGGPDILGVEDAAHYLGVHPQTVRNYIRSGKLPAYRLAGERFLRVLRKDLLALLERVRADGEPDAEEASSLSPP